MIEQAIEIRTPDATVDGALLRPDDKPRPGVIHLTDIGGIREAHHQMARRTAELGYAVLMPNVFHRTGRPPMWDFPRKMGEERTMKRFRELVEPLSPEAMERDCAAYVDFLLAQDGVAGQKVAVIGHCFTGAMALRTAAARPEQVALAVSFHGGHLYTDAPTSPHLVLPRIRARLYFAHSVEDPTMSAEAIAALDEELERWGGRSDSEIYAGARHGWTSPDSPVHDAEKAERAFSKLSALLAETLPA